VRATARGTRVRPPKNWGDNDPLGKQESSLTFSRRELLIATAVPVLFAAAPLPGQTTPAKADDRPSPGDLGEAGPDGDVVLGSDKAPVTVIEYASMTCPHCANFSRTTFPELKRRYIDTGKVRFIFREFPLDALAASGSVLARCAGNDNDKYMAIVETLFAKQSDWMVREPLAPLKAIAKQFGLTEDSLSQCLANQKLLDDIQGVRDHAVKKLGVKSTPTFFINGKKLVGDVSIEAMAKQIEGGS
jgi:protein-disulfide isomerase